MKKLAAHPRLARVLVFALCLFAGVADAQFLRVPQLSLPALPREPLAPVQQTVQALQQTRTTLARELIRRNPQAVEADPAGEPIRRAELLWLSPANDALAAARAEGFAVLREENLAELDVHEFVMRPPAGMSTAQGADRLRALDANATVDFNHLYMPSGEAAGGAAPHASASASAPGAIRVGLVDGGIAREHEAFRGTTFVHWGCNGRDIASEHGTAIASLLAGAQILAADVYCGDPAGGAAEDVARALAWMTREHVAVINVSLVGPSNRLLERAVAALVQRGHLIVAAVGNDGPAAPPLYPACYPGVVGVTGVMRGRHVLPEAAQGPQVMFAAPGADVRVANPEGGYTKARGTSYAAPVVARSLAPLLREPGVQGAHAAIAQLASTAIDLGDPGRDAVFGFGLVGTSR
jgi:subtilisin family serine protease